MLYTQGIHGHPGEGGFDGPVQDLVGGRVQVVVCAHASACTELACVTVCASVRACKRAYVRACLSARALTHACTCDSVSVIVCACVSERGAYARLCAAVR